MDKKAWELTITEKNNIMRSRRQDIIKKAREKALSNLK